MSKYRALLKVRSFQSGQAQPIRDRRHVHVTDRPFVMAYVQMAGEPFTMWACLYGRDRENPYWTVAADPRNRDLQSAAFDEFAEVLTSEVAAALEDDLEPLQLWVSNSGAGRNLARLGRVMRIREVSPAVSLAGSYLDLYAQAMSAPGSALCIAATEALSSLRVTGQSDLEDANLAAQLVWWNTQHLAAMDSSTTKRAAKAMSAFDAARHAEKMPMGTLTSPEVDEQDLEKLVTRLSNARRENRSDAAAESELSDALYGQVLPIWTAIWLAHDEVTRVTATSTATRHWVEDGRAFRWQFDFLAGGGNRRFFDSPMRAAQLLARWETANADSVRASVCEDRLALIEAILDNTAVAGKVAAVEWVKSGRREHPFITIDSPATEVTADTEVWWREDPAVSGIVEETEDRGDAVRLVIHVTAGMTKHDMPRKGQQIAFITQAPGFPIQPKMPKQLPWSHVPRADASDKDDDDD